MQSKRNKTCHSKRNSSNTTSGDNRQKTGLNADRPATANDPQSNPTTICSTSSMGCMMQMARIKRPD